MAVPQTALFSEKLISYNEKCHLRRVQWSWGQAHSFQRIKALNMDIQRRRMDYYQIVTDLKRSS